MKIHVGSGGVHKEGFINQDIRDVPGVEIVCDALDLRDHVEPKAVSYFYSRHFFEHLTFDQGKEFVKIQHDLLMDGGFIEMVLPDLEYHCWQILHPRPSEHIDRLNMTVHQHARGSLFGWQRESNESLWDVHKSGYTYQDMVNLLSASGFVNINRIKSIDPWHLHVVAIKG